MCLQHPYEVISRPVVFNSVVFSRWSAIYSDAYVNAAMHLN